MKRFFQIFLCFSIITSSLLVVGCNEKKDSIIEDAVEEITEYWEELYSEDNTGDGYFEIKNTRIIHIKENDTEEFKDVKYIIEFVIYSDYFSSAPYYSNVNIHNNVVVNKDGSTEVVSNMIDNYRSKTYNSDFSDFIEKTVDHNDEYNCVKDLKQ